MYFLRGSIGRLLANFLLVPACFLVSIKVYAQSAPGTAAVLQGIVSNGANNMPVVGAKVIVNGKQVWSVSGGVYSISIDPVGTFPVSCAKAGFESFTSPPVVFQPGSLSQMNIQLWENLNPPVGVVAYNDTVTQHVPVSWSSPSGNYELIYDDGIQDNFAIWYAGGNMNALKFTPLGYPVKFTGGAINIGGVSNYPAGSNPLVPFQVRVYDASGAGGTPGNSIAGPFEITPAGYGWVEFTLPTPVTINSGAFYIVMIQSGNAPDAAGIAVDETNPQFRSYSRYVSGNGPWYPAGGNFMMRAKCEGSGGPAYMLEEPLVTGVSNIYRLRQGEEQNPSAWTMVGSTTGLSIIDSSWSALPCGPYRWGVKSQYSGNRWSPVAFSNILGKCWTAPVSIHLSLSCETSTSPGSQVTMSNVAYPDTVYAGEPDSSGLITFPHVWKGTYQLSASRFGYDTLYQSVPVVMPVLTNVVLLQITSPPANLVVNDSNLMARWDVPHFEREIFSEKWTGGNFTSNAWSIDGGGNWSISGSLGHPSPSAMFGSIPFQTNYTQSLVSKMIAGQHSTLLKLRFDIFLDNLGATTVNQMAVEIWDGTLWHSIKNFSSSEGSIPWTREDLDISEYTDMSFRFRFRAYGEDTHDINNWNVDNIEIIASEPAQEQANCVLGYYFYLGNVISGYTTKNAYPIPGNQVQYGQTYHACVRALYGSGYSDSTCTTFTSQFLYPVLNLHGYPVENTAFIAWEKPLAATDTTLAFPNGLIGYTIMRDDSIIATLGDPDSLYYYDPGLEPGYYRYGVAARYDLTAYGYPGQTGESVAAGPLHVTISWGRQLPFFEPWDAGTFSFNEWRFNPSQGNWVIEPNEGLPSPAANFRWQPPVVNYDFALESPPFNGLPFNCAAVWLDFDIKLNDRNYTGTEKMIVEAYYNNTWHKKAEIRNTGSFPWTNYHIDISPVRGKGFRVRFRATGQNSSEILNWYLDNVNIYPVCYPVINLAGHPSGNSVRLTWSPPACYGGNLLHEGFEEANFPPPQWEKQTTNPTETWSHFSALSLTGVHTGNFSAGINWDYNHQDEWLIANNIYVNGNLTFWSYAIQGSQHLDHYYVKVSADQGATWTSLLDLSSLPPYPSNGGINAWLTPYHVDLSMFAGETVDIAWHAVDGDGNGLWYPWAIDDCTIGADDSPLRLLPRKGAITGPTDAPGSTSDILGYDIYRESGGTNIFAKINAALVNDTVWTDQGLSLGQYKYFVKPAYSECDNAANSDTILIDIVTGLNQIASSGLSAYPNPANEQVTISGNEIIEKVTLYEITGKPVETWIPEAKYRITIDVRRFKQGLYLLVIQSGGKVRNVKLCLQR